MPQNSAVFYDIARFVIELPHLTDLKIVALFGDHLQEDALGYMRFKAVALGAVDHLLRIGAVSIAIVLFDAPDEFQEEPAGGAFGVDVGGAQTVCRQATHMRRPLQDDRAPSQTLATVMPAMMPPGVPPTITASKLKGKEDGHKESSF